MRTGSKVVCVDDKFPVEILIYYTHIPIKDRIYTIRDIGVGVGIDGEAGQIAVTLEEIGNPKSKVAPYMERGFKQERFQEIQEPEDVENFAEQPEEELV